MLHRPGRALPHGSAAEAGGAVVETALPARLDRLPWSRWHWRVILALGITWVLDGLSVTIVGALGPRLESPETLGLSATEVSALGSAYIVGAVGGALVFGYLTDRIGRKKLFLVTLSFFMVFSVCSGLAWDFWSFAVFRVLMGAGIGGEYAAINSAIDELIPARVRGRVDLSINGSYWIGAAIGALLTLPLLDTSLVPIDLGWRLAFLLGVAIAIPVMVARRRLPESPRWLVIHRREQEAEAVVAAIEEEVAASTGAALREADGSVRIRQRDRTPIAEILRTLFATYRQRSLLGLVMMTSQAFFYNAIFFTYGLVLTTFFDVSASRIGLFLLPFAAGNFLGPLVLGPLFDRWGRRAMITVTYALAGTALLVTGYLFKEGVLTEVTQTACWVVAFFFASAAASSAYLTVSEVFPLETRGLAIAIFYAIGTAAGGISGPLLFGRLIDTESRTNVFYGYVVGSALMLIAAVVAAFLAVGAERRSLEEVATPLSAELD